MAAVTAARNLSRGTVLAERLEIQRSLWGRFRGLMGRASLPAGAGLFLTGTNGIHMFFMRFPIDAVFVGPDRRVVRVVENLRPWRIVAWARGARDCLELPVGAVRASGTQVGDELALESV